MKTAERLTANPTSSRRRHRLRWVLIGLGGAIVAGVLLVALAIRALAPPKLPSLAKHPDTSLNGSVAYLRNRPNGAWCLTVAAASGAKTTDLVCGDRDAAPDVVRWAENGNVQIFQTAPGADRYGKEIDPRSKVVTALDAEAIPPFQKQEPADSATLGDATVSVRSMEGLTELILTSPSGTRALLTLKAGSMEFPYAISTPRWSADGTWILASDSAGRLLLVTVGPPSATRVLIERNARGGGMYDPGGPAL